MIIKCKGEQYLALTYSLCGERDVWKIFWQDVKIIVKTVND
jgi:hypothetical protein